MSHIRVSSLALRWTLAISLTASPLIAEEASRSSSAGAAHRPVVRVVDENNNPLVGDTILLSLADPSQGPSTDRTATELGGPRESGEPGNPAPSDKKAEPGGKTLSTLIIAALITGGVVALLLLLHGGDKKPAVSTAAGPAPHTDTPTGTVLAPGTPGVTAPH